MEIYKINDNKDYPKVVNLKEALEMSEETLQEIKEYMSE